MKIMKRAQMKYVVGIILILAAFFIILGLTGKIIGIMTQSGSEAKCTASAQLSSQTKVAGVETVSLDCPMKLVEIKMDDLRAETTKAKKEIERIQSSEKKTGISYFANPDATKINEFALDKKVAEEMETCWQKLGEGQLELFNAWYNPITTGEISWAKWLPTLKTPPITCVICARIKFDSEIQEKYPNVQSFDEWLKINTVPKKDITYYDFLIDEVHDQFLFTPSWSFQTKEPIAVVFARMNYDKSKGVLRNVLDNFGVSDLGKAQKGIDALYLIEYSKAGEYCDYLANTPPEEE
jgi:hypothetical protein